jgi:hypothetical protein
VEKWLYASLVQLKSQNQKKGELSKAITEAKKPTMECKSFS